MSSFVDGEGAVLTSEAAASVGDRTIPFDMDESIFLFQCLSKLSAPDLLSCGLVNKTFFRLCQDDMLWDQVKDKVLHRFNEWALTLKIPQYLKLARIIPLSKEANTAFPAHG